MTSRPRVFVIRPDFAPSAIETLRQKCDVTMYEKTDEIPRGALLKRVAGQHAVLLYPPHRVDKEFLDAAGEQLKVVGTTSVGFEHIDVEECKRRKVTVGYTPDILTDAVAELTVTILLAAARRVLEGIQHVRGGTWGVNWTPYWLCGRGLANSTVGIVGLGRIGEGVLKRLEPFNVKRFLYTGRSEKPNAKALGASYVSFEDLLEQSDFVIAICALTEQTKEMFNKQAFSRMKNTAVFVNTGRGGLVDQDALYEALTTGQIRAAGLDVTTPEPLPPKHPLNTLDNCVITPHIGSAEMDTRIGMIELTVANILAGLEGKPLPAKLC